MHAVLHEWRCKEPAGAKSRRIQDRGTWLPSPLICLNGSFRVKSANMRMTEMGRNAERQLSLVAVWRVVGRLRTVRFWQ